MRQETPNEETSIPAAQPLASFGSTIDAPNEPHHQTEMDIYHGTSVSPSAYHSMDDIFAPESTGLPIDRQSTSEPRGDADMSLDTRRLRAQHNTVGYREGITAGKAASIQAGFDQGFSLGATIGMKAGQILGLLEGIGNALADAGLGEESAYAASLLSRAAADLKPERLFTTEYWGPDGTWTYPVVPSDQDGEIIYPDVADQHPLITTWSRIAREEAMRWSVDPAIRILENSEPSAKDSPEARETTSRPGVASPDPLHW